MSTPISNATQNTGAVSTTKNESSADKVQAQKPTATSMRDNLNTMIIEASLKVSISSGDNAQGLLYKSSLESIYEAVFGKFESKITPDYQMPSMTDPNNPYATPEGTANVILSFSLGLYESYASHHKNEDPAEVAQNFIDLIRGGFEKGYGEAVDILTGMGVFEGNIASEIGKTWDLVQQGYDDWLAAKLESLQPKPETQPETQPAEPTETKVAE
ncbi:DUF5610 domain-containing protein [Oxalobacter sp. OttesenSCG-928-P03]|nr:DUF5610 domain-containing protein [Oxalobacter sp. OttesenSCG-928-P03]